MTAHCGGKEFDEARRLDGILLGKVIEISDSGPQVAFSGSPGKGGAPARSMITLSAEDVGAEVVLALEGGDPTKPLVLGLLQRRDVLSAVDEAEVEIDGSPERVEITGQREITLRCGKASITLTRDGKIILRGTHISSRSSGVNRIKGGSVQIN